MIMWPLPYESFKRHTDKLMNSFNGDINYLLDQSVSLHSVILSLEHYNKVLLSESLVEKLYIKYI